MRTLFPGRQGPEYFLVDNMVSPLFGHPDSGKITLGILRSLLALEREDRESSHFHTSYNPTFSTCHSATLSFLTTNMHQTHTYNAPLPTLTQSHTLNSITHILNSHTHTTIWHTKFTHMKTHTHTPTPLHTKVAHSDTKRTPHKYTHPLLILQTHHTSTINASQFDRSYIHA